MPAVRAALDWMENFGDADRDGFIEYRRGAESGLQQSRLEGFARFDLSCRWRAGARGDRRRRGAGLCRCGEPRRQRKSRPRSARRSWPRIWSRQRPDWPRPLTNASGARASAPMRWPWMAETSMCRAHIECGPCPFLRGGVAGESRTRGPRLDGPRLFSGWGIRTVAIGESRYNPISYHNGTSGRTTVPSSRPDLPDTEWGSRPHKS